MHCKCATVQCEMCIVDCVSRLQEEDDDGSDSDTPLDMSLTATARYCTLHNCTLYTVLHTAHSTTAVCTAVVEEWNSVQCTRA